MTDRAPNRFADFIREATPEEKEAVYMDVMKKATDRQNAMTDRAPETPFIYKLNAMDAAASEDNPAQHGYAAKRKAVLDHVSELEAANAELRARNEAMEGLLKEARYYVVMENHRLVLCQASNAAADSLRDRIDALKEAK